MGDRAGGIAIKRIILDTDTGADDALAIIFALLSTELRIEAITTVSGNVHVGLCTRNARLVVEQLGVSDPPPICRGVDVPLAKPLLTAPEVHGYDGIGNITRLELANGRRKYPEPTLPESDISAVDAIVDLAQLLGPDLTIVTLGPLTNIAMAIREDREAMQNIREIIIMGGAFRVYGNTTAVAEFNIFVDPQAAQEVLDLGVPTTIVPLDVTERTTLTRTELQKAFTAHPTKALEMVRDISDHYMRYHAEHDSIDGCYMHDPLAVGVAINPDFIHTTDALVQIERAGEHTEGMTVSDLRPKHRPTNPNARVAVDVDSRAFLDFFLQRLS